METQQQIKFIQGKFDPEDAKEILTHLVSHKIHFHTMKNFSSLERFGVEVEGSQKRIAQLKEAREQIASIIQHAADNNYVLNVESTINISFEQ